MPGCLQRVHRCTYVRTNHTPNHHANSLTHGIAEWPPDNSTNHAPERNADDISDRGAHGRVWVDPVFNGLPGAPTPRVWMEFPLQHVRPRGRHTPRRTWPWILPAHYSRTRDGRTDVDSHHRRSNHGVAYGCSHCIPCCILLVCGDGSVPWWCGECAPVQQWYSVLLCSGMLLLWRVLPRL